MSPEARHPAQPVYPFPVMMPSQPGVPQAFEAPTQEPAAAAPPQDAYDASLAESAAEPATDADETNEMPAAAAPNTSKRAPRPSLPPQKGTTVFPLARISKIIKADSAVDICSKEATFLISIATVCL